MTKTSIHQSTIKTNLTALLLGSIYPLALAPWNWWGLGILSVTGLILLLKDMPASSCFWRCFWFGTGMFGVGLWWVYVSIHDFSHTSAPTSAGLTLLFVISRALYFALPLMLYSAFNRHPISAIFAFPCLWIITEWLRQWFISGWLHLGYGFIDTPLAGWAPITGVLSISWIAVFCAAVLATIITERKRHRASLRNCLLLAASLWTFGWLATGHNWTAPHTKTVDIGTIQPSLSPTTKWDPRKLKDILSLYRNQTQQLNGQDIIIWPESAIPRFDHEVNDYLQEISNEATLNEAALIIGSPTRNLEKRQSFNSVIGLGLAEGKYNKQNLVPFGEYVPLESWLRGRIGFFDLPMSKFTPGNSQQPPISAKGISIATPICYEATFPQLVSQMAINANLLLTVSNDSWFGDSLGPKQHFEMARMRALENGKPMIRATNNGISAIINHQGNVTTTVPAFESTVMKGTVTPHSGTTPFNHLGGSIIWLALLAVAVLRVRRER